MEFHFRLRSTRVSALYALLVEHGYPRATAAARSGAIEGLMHGYVDLLYRDDVGAFHVLDYTTNRLGDYPPAVCAQAIAATDYDLQSLIYLLPLQRWIRMRLGAVSDPAHPLPRPLDPFLPRP